VRNVRLVETGAKPRVTRLNDDNVLVIEEDRFVIPLDSNPRVGMGKLPRRLSFLLSLSKMKHSEGAVELRADVLSYLIGQVPFGRGKNASLAITGLGTLPAVKVLSVVRRPHQLVTVPEFSRETSLTVGQAKTGIESPLTSNFQGGAPAISVDVPLFWKGEGFSTVSNDPLIDLGQPYIEDAHGKKYRRFKYGKNKYFSFNANVGSSTSSNSNITETSVSYSFPTDAIPFEAGQLTLKTRISGNGEWPVSVSVVVRRANEKQLAPPPLKIVSTQVRPLNQDDKGDTEVVVKVQPALPATDLESFGRELITYWSQHLVDARGMEYSNFAQWGTWTTYPNGIHAPVTKRQQQTSSMDTSQEVDQQNHQIVIHYKFFLNQVPMKTGRVLFKTDIGMKGYKFLPVSVIVRN